MARSCLDFLPLVSAPPMYEYLSLSALGNFLGVARVTILPSGSNSTLLVQEKSLFCVLDNPCQSCLQMIPCDCAALENIPFVRFDCIQVQSLKVSVVPPTESGRVHVEYLPYLIISHTTTHIGFVGEDK